MSEAFCHGITLIRDEPVLFTIMALFAVSNLAFAQTFNVSTSQELRQALEDATTNGQSDVIKLTDGTYKTTDDGGGTFTFLDNEDYSLTIQGSAAENVILSGDNTDQVLNFKIINYTQTIYLSNLSVINGNATGNGGGIESQADLDIENCSISDNTSYGYGGGFYSSTATVSSSTILGNTADENGGGFYAGRSTTGVSKSTTSLARFLDTSMIVEKTLKAGISINIVRFENRVKNMGG